MSLGSGRGLAVPSPDACGRAFHWPHDFSLAPLPDRKLGRRWEPHNCLVTTASEDGAQRKIDNERSDGLDVSADTSAGARC